MKTTNANFINWTGFLLCLLLFSQCQPAKPSLQAYRQNKSKHINESKLREELIAFARNFIGCPYKKAGKNKSGFDCSGFVAFVFNDFDIRMPASAHEQALIASSIRIEEAEKGDLIFFSNQNKITHVGIITANSKEQLKVIHSTSSRGIVEENILKSDYWLRRINKLTPLNSYLRSVALSVK